MKEGDKIETPLGIGTYKKEFLASCIKRHLVCLDHVPGMLSDLHKKQGGLYFYSHEIFDIKKDPG